MKKLGHMVLKAVNSVQNDKIRSNGYTVMKLGKMVLKEVNWVPNDKIR